MKNPIFDIENWREIGTTLAQNKTRTFMTAFGIFWGTAILAMLIGGSRGLKTFMSIPGTHHKVICRIQQRHGAGNESSGCHKHQTCPSPD